MSMNFAKFLNFKSILFGAGIFALIIAVLGFSGKLPFFNSSSKQKLTGTVKVWGTIPSTSMNLFVDAFDKEAKTYNMVYTEIPYDSFNKKLTQALADGYAPDLIIAPSEIAYANQNRIAPVLPTTISEASFKNTFADISSQLIDMPNGYLGLPISVDPLVLYYNRDILSSNGFSQPPTTWGEFYNYEEKITKINNGNVNISTIAFGTYDNIPHISDIILSIVLQQGSTLITKTLDQDATGNISTRYLINMDDTDQNSDISPLNSALAFTKDFSDTQKSTYDWNAKSGNALDEFISGNLAFYIGFASEKDYIISANQKLNLDYTYLPQISGSKTTATYGKLYTIFMLRTSSNQNLSYQVLVALGLGSFSQNLVSVTGGLSALKANINSSMSSGDQQSEIFGKSVLISKNFYDLHRSDLESLMREAIRQVYNGEKSTAEASKTFSDNLQAIYDGQNE